MNKAPKPSRFSGVSGVRVAAETAIALLAGTLGVLAIFWPDWIEALTGWDPDRHNGSLEWMIVAVLLVIAAAVGATAWRGWRLRGAASRSPS